MRLQRLVCVLAAACAVALSFAPYLSAPVDALSLSTFATDQPPALWLGRAAVVLLVIAAAASFRSLRLAAGCAIAAVVAAALPAMVSQSRGAVPQGWVSYVGTPTPPHLPTVYAAPMWGLGWLLALSTFTAGVLIVASTRPEQRGLRLAVALLTLVAIGASLAVARPETLPDAGTPRRYVDYLPSSSGSTGSASGWLAAVTVALVILAVATARLRRGRPDPPRSSVP